MTDFSDTLTYWQDRRAKLGDGAVGRKGEDYLKQGERISRLLSDVLNGFFQHGLDFGCGWGRLSLTLAGCCGHLWAADIIDDWAIRAAALAPNISSLHIIDETIRLDPESMDLVVDVMSLQSIQSDWLHLRACKELRRVLRKGGLFVSLAKMDDPLRTRRTQLVGLADVSERLNSDVDQAGDKYCLLVGTRI